MAPSGGDPNPFRYRTYDYDGAFEMLTMVETNKNHILFAKGQ